MGDQNSESLPAFILSSISLSPSPQYPHPHAEDGAGCNPP